MKCQTKDSGQRKVLIYFMDGPAQGKVWKRDLFPGIYPTLLTWSDKGKVIYHFVCQETASADSPRWAIYAVHPPRSLSLEALIWSLLNRLHKIGEVHGNEVCH